MSCLKPPARSVARPPTAGPPPSLPASGPPPTPPPAAGPPPVGSAPAKASRTARARSLADTRPRLRARNVKAVAHRCRPSARVFPSTWSGVQSRSAHSTSNTLIRFRGPLLQHVDPVPWSVAHLYYQLWRHGTSMASPLTGRRVGTTLCMVLFLF